MCEKCKLVSLISDDIYTCFNCGYRGRTDPKNPGHCPGCGHDMREQTEILPHFYLHG